MVSSSAPELPQQVGRLRKEGTRHGRWGRGLNPRNISCAIFSCFVHVKIMETESSFGLAIGLQVRKGRVDVLATDVASSNTVHAVQAVFSVISSGNDLVPDRLANQHETLHCTRHLRYKANTRAVEGHLAKGTASVRRQLHVRYTWPNWSYSRRIHSYERITRCRVRKILFTQMPGNAVFFCHSK